MHFKIVSSGFVMVALYLTAAMAYWDDRRVFARDPSGELPSSNPDHLMTVRHRALDILDSTISRRFEIVDELSTRDLVEALEARMFLHRRGGGGTSPPPSPSSSKPKPLPAADANKGPPRPNSPSQKGAAKYGIYDILLRHASKKHTPVAKLPKKKIKILHRKAPTHHT